MNIDLKSIVRITSDSIVFDWSNPFNKSKNTESIGTGFFISDELILTCAHVVNGSKNLYIEIPSKDSNKYSCKIIGICPDFDIAIINDKIDIINLFLTYNTQLKSKISLPKELFIKTPSKSDDTT